MIGIEGPSMIIDTQTYLLEIMRLRIPGCIPSRGTSLFRLPVTNSLRWSWPQVFTMLGLMGQVFAEVMVKEPPPPSLEWFGLVLLVPDLADIVAAISSF